MSAAKRGLGWTTEGVIHKLPPLAGDNVGVALRGNDQGQVAGTSGLCSNTQVGGFPLGPHAVLWDHGTPINLGSLGGTVSVTAAVNDRGQVVGGAAAPDGSTHPFLWTRATGMRGLGLMSTDPADAANTPFQINDHGQMVGASCDITLATCRGYIWQNAVMTDINDLLPPDSSPTHRLVRTPAPRCQPAAWLSQLESLDAGKRRTARAPLDALSRNTS
jgi:probable HAF family extracellular repeat protein